MPLTEADVKGFMKAFLQSLSTCHERWVLHRDVKPNNLLITPTGLLMPPSVPLLILNQSAVDPDSCSSTHRSAD